MSGDMPLYVKVGCRNLCFEYRAAFQYWQMKLTAHKGKDIDFAFRAVPAKCLPEDCPADKWKISFRGPFLPLPGFVISVVTQEEVDAYQQ